MAQSPISKKDATPVEVDANQNASLVNTFFPTFSKLFKGQCKVSWNMKSLFVLTAFCSLPSAWISFCFDAKDKFDSLMNNLASQSSAIDVYTLTGNIGFPDLDSSLTDYVIPVYPNVLEIVEDPIVSDLQLEQIFWEYLTPIETVNITNKGVTDKSLEYFQGLESLTSLSLSASITGTGFSDIVSLPIERLRLEDNPLDASTLEELLGLQNLTVLCVLNSGLDDDDLKYLSKFKNLVLLNLSDNNISGLGFVHLEGLTNLKSLHLEQCSLDIDCLKDLLDKLPNIERVSITYPTSLTDIEKLNLIFDSVIVDSVSNYAECKCFKNKLNDIH